MATVKKPGSLDVKTGGSASSVFNPKIDQKKTDVQNSGQGIFDSLATLGNSVAAERTAYAIQVKG